MNDIESQSGHTPATEPRSVNPYLDKVTGAQPAEIADYEMRSDPYGNMLPGISSINVARTVSAGVEVGRKGNKLLYILSIFLLAVLLLPAILAVVVHFS